MAHRLTNHLAGTALIDFDGSRNSVKLTPGESVVVSDADFRKIKRLPNGVTTTYASDGIIDSVQDVQNVPGFGGGGGPGSVTSVAGKTGVVTLVKADVGLSNVDNTSDLNKPISTAVQTALDAIIQGTNFSWVVPNNTNIGWVAGDNPGVALQMLRMDVDNKFFINEIGLDIDIRGNGKLLDSGNTTSVDWGARTLNDIVGDATLSWMGRGLYQGGQTVLNWGSGILADTSSGQISMDWFGRTLNDGSSAVALNYQTRHLLGQNGTDVMQSWGLDSYGPTVDRPVLSAGAVGYKYFDTDENKPVFWSGSAWVTFDGVANWNWDLVGNLQQNSNITLNENDNLNIQPLVYNTNIEITAHDPSDQVCAQNYYINVDTTSSGHDFGTNGRAVTVRNVGVYHLGTSSVGEIVFDNLYAGIGNGSNPVSVRGVAGSYFNPTFSNSTLTGNLQGYVFQPQLQSNSTHNGYTNAFADFANIEGTLSNGWNSFTANPQISQIPSSGNFIGMQVSPTIANVQSSANVFGVNVSPVMSGTGGFFGVNVNPQTSTCKDATGIYVNMTQVSTYAGTYSSLILQDLTYTFNQVGENNNFQVAYSDSVTAGNEVAVLTGGNLITVSIESGVTTALQVKAAIEANFTLASALTITVSGTGSNPQVTQIATNFTGGTWPGNKKAAEFVGDVSIQGALSFQGALSIGQLNAFSTHSLADTGGSPASTHLMITNPTVAPNAVLTTGDYLGINTAMLLNIGANASVGSGLFGVNALGLPAVVNMASGSSLNRVGGAVFALSLDSSAGGGIIDTVSLCRALAIPNGVTTVNNLYGYEFSLPLGSVSANTWALYMDVNCQSYLKGNLKIGGTNTTTNADIGFEVQGKHLKTASGPTSARDALTAVNGCIWYNEDTNKFQGYANGSWVDLH